MPADDSIDFDRLPSPRRSPLSSRTNGAQHSSGRRSKLSFVQYSDQDINGDTVGTDDMDIVQDDDYPPEPEPEPEPVVGRASRERSRSFSEMNQDDDEPSSPQKEPTPPRPASDKRRKKVRSPSLSRIEETVEEDIAQGLDDLDGQEEESEPERQPKPTAKSSKRSSAKEQPKKLPEKRVRAQKTVLPLSGMWKLLIIFDSFC